MKGFPILFRSRVLRQTVQLYGSQLIAIGAGLLLNIINTRWLTPTGYGVYSLCFVLAGFVELFTNFGFFSSGARVLALNRGSREKEREIIGMLLLIALGLGALASLVVFRSVSATVYLPSGTS